MEAVGLPPDTLIKANLADAVVVPPRRRSRDGLPVCNEPFDNTHCSVPNWQTPVPVTIPFVVVTQEGDPSLIPAVPFIFSVPRFRLRTPVPFPGLREMFPVVSPPRVRVLFLKDWIDPFEERTMPLPALLPEVAETEAVGVSPAILRTANLAD